MNLNKFKFGSFVTNSTSSITMARPKLGSLNISNITSKFSIANFRRIPSKKIALSLIILVVVAAGILIVLSQFGRNETFTQKISAEVPINKSFGFPVYDAEGKVTDIKLTINLTSAQKMKDILIQGKPATAREGKIFLILNMEIANDFNQQLKIAPVGLIRLVDATGKKFAPDVHNEEVTVEPISVKKTRVGFVVDSSPSGFNLQVGEVNGSKETVSLAF